MFFMFHSCIRGGTGHNPSFSFSGPSTSSVLKRNLLIATYNSKSIRFVLIPSLKMQFGGFSVATWWRPLKLI